MHPLLLLKCVAKAVVKGLGKAAGIDAAFDVAEEAMKEWNREADVAARREELVAVVRMAGDEFRRQVEAVVREVAVGQPAETRERVSTYLQGLPERIRRTLRRPEDRSGTSLPPGFPIDAPADLAPLLPRLSPPPPATEDGSVPQLPPTADDSPWVRVRYTAGAFAGQEVLFTEPTVLLFGRTEDCDPHVPKEKHPRVSRRHCFLEVNPPDVRVRDLGSMHGTFLNGNLIGKRPRGASPSPEYESPEHAVTDGSEIRLADRDQVAFAVHVHAPARLAALTCSQCGREVAEPGADRPGDFVCAACRDRVGTVMQDAASSAREGNQHLIALRDYKILGELGRGGMGAVYMARHRMTGMAAAIKLMLPKVAADEKAVALFQREIRNTMALGHRNVVKCRDHGFSKGAFYLVLDYCDAGSVAGLMAEHGGKLPVDEAVEIALQALDGLHYAHHAPIPFVRQKDGTWGQGRGLVHRDVKPANLFLSGSGSGRTVQVGDYGLAKAFDEAGLSGGTRTGACAGTPKFMCRKQVIRYKSAGPEVDVWSLAASLYAMLTGHSPRDFPKGKDPWLVVLEDVAVPIRRRNPNVPELLANVIDAALNEMPEVPFKTAAALKQSLEDVA